MDAFDDTFGESTPPATEKSTNGNGNGLLEDEADPAAEFLAREQSNFAGLEDEIPVTTSESAEGGFGGFTNGTGEITNGNVIAEDDFGATNGNGLGLGDEFTSGDSPLNDNGYQQNVFVQREEPEKIKIWREEQTRRLEVKDAEEEESKEKLRLAAKKELDDWYKNYEEQISKTRNSNRKEEQEGAAAAESPTESGKEWEKIANLCDFNPKSSKQQKDISRMRSLILQLKQNPPSSRRQSSAGSSSAS